MLKNKKVIIAVVAAILLLIILSTTIILLTNGEGKNTEENNVEESIDTESLEIEFKKDFLSEETEYVKTRQKIEQSKVGKYDVKAYMPKIDIEEEEAQEINSEIYKLSANIINEAVKAEKYAKYNLEYASFVNNNILSLVVRFTVKEGENPRRVIIKTYNYDIEKNERVELMDIISKEQEEKIQEKINNKIKEANERANKIVSQGYSAYIRDIDDSIYEIENATEFFIGENNILYIIYAYGNQEYTDEMDLIIHKI